MAGLTTTAAGHGKEMVWIEFDFRDFYRMLRAGEAYQPAAAKVINKGASRTRTAIIRDVAKTARISPQRLIRQRMRLKGATRNRLVARLGILTKAIPVTSLSRTRDTRKKTYDPTGQGVYTGGGRHFPKAFIARGRERQALHAFERTGSARKPLRVHKVAVKELVERILPEKLRTVGLPYVKKNIVSQIMFEMNRGSRLSR